MQSFEFISVRVNEKLSILDEDWLDFLDWQEGEDNTLSILGSRGFDLVSIIPRADYFVAFLRRQKG